MAAAAATAATAAVVAAATAVTPETSEVVATECAHVMSLNVSDRCAFVEANPDCQHSNGGLIEYTHIFFCSFEDQLACEFDLNCH